ncbi:MAG: hypothetical protein IKX28_04220 [Bacteroidales bacterium]|nr:hypothetical protein [Bacteroidales bacterium]
MFSDLASYYLHWYHGRPVGITPARRDELRRLHDVLYRCAEYFVLHYEDYVPSRIPLSDKEMEVLALQAQTPFRAGTWRPDYLVTREGGLKLCEITSRFFAHGIFMSCFAEYAADAFMGRFPGRERESRYGELMEYMRALPGGSRRMYVLKSADRTSEIRLYRRFYETQGLTFTEIAQDEVEARRGEWAREGTFVVSALNQRDLMGYGMDTLRAMVDVGMVSDFRNILLLHDKRFMRLWDDGSFTSRCLSAEDAAFLRAHSIPTRICCEPETEPLLEDAFLHKDAYILKPWRLGKSEGVFAGPLTKEGEWRRLWKRGRDGSRPVDGMVLQPFLEQRTFSTEFEGKPFDDYLCGMMLCVDDRYFDSGLFRTSSLPVTNVGDDRKACPLHTADPEILACCDVL